MSATLNTILIAISVPLFAGAAFMLGLGLWDLFLGKLLGETAEERTGFVKALQTVALRQLGVVSRRFMWPSYEAAVRRKLITAGEPSQLKPEEVMAMQELGTIVGLVFGLFVLNATDVNLVYSLLFGLLGLWYPRL